LMIEYYKTPQGQKVRQNQQRLKQRLQGVWLWIRPFFFRCF
jgi:hypothetical protein